MNNRITNQLLHSSRPVIVRLSGIALLVLLAVAALPLYAQLFLVQVHPTLITKTVFGITATLTGRTVSATKSTP